MELVKPDYYTLWAPTEPVIDIKTQVLPHIDEMRKIMEDNKGVGLAATQVGIPYSFFISNVLGHKLVINPVITELFGHKVRDIEGCLTWPGQDKYVTRQNGVKFTWFNHNSVKQTSTLIGYNSRVIQHEIDHLNGKCIFFPPCLQEDMEEIRNS